MADKKLIVKIKLEERDKASSILMYLIGWTLIIIGAGGILVSIPFFLIIVGFFTGIGFAFMLFIGVGVIRHAKYKPSIATCPNCKVRCRLNLLTDQAFTCPRCQKRILVEGK
ncbi:MAG: hypothetical protein AABX72_02990 [Nanoarchaeota archaeon]